MYDLIIVGSSFASTFFLKKYLERNDYNKKVLVLERGHLYPTHERINDRRNVYHRIETANPNPDSEDTFINLNPNKPWHFSVGFGGSSNCWFGCTPRFLPSDFKMKSLYGVAMDWPLSYAELEPYYEEAEILMDVSGPDITPFPKNNSYPQPPHLFTEIDDVLHAHYKEKYIHQPCARSRIAKNGRGACCASAICSTCPVNAKFTIENSGFEVYEDPRVELLYGAQVLSLSTEGKTAKGVVYIKDGKEHTVSGDVVALGANAIFNAHILLNSGDPLKYTGKGLGEQAAIQVHVHLEDLKNTGGSTWVNAIGYMLYDGPHRSESAACLIESGNHTFMRIESGKWRNLASLRVIFEDLPLDHNQVKLSDDQQKPAIEHHGSSVYVEKGIERFKKQLPDVLSCLPVEEIIYRGKHPTESHILGSTRMSNTPEEGVVDKNLVHHHYRNVFVLGSGSFASYTPSNPTLTLSALSLRAADKSF